MLSDRNPDGGGVALHVPFVSQLADTVFLIDLLLPSQSYSFHLSQTNKEKLFLLLESLPACSASWSDSYTWASDT